MKAPSIITLAIGILLAIAIAIAMRLTISHFAEGLKYVPTAVGLITGIIFFVEGATQKDENKKRVARNVPAGHAGILFLLGTPVPVRLGVGNHFMMPWISRLVTQDCRIQTITVPELKPDGTPREPIMATAYGSGPAPEEVEFDCRVSIEVQCVDPVNFICNSSKQAFSEALHNTMKTLLRRFLADYHAENIVSNKTPCGRDLRVELAEKMRDDLRLLPQGNRLGDRHGWSLNFATLQIPTVQRKSEELRKEIARIPIEKVQREAAVTQQQSFEDSFNRFFALYSKSLPPAEAAKLARIDAQRNIGVKAADELVITGGNAGSQLGALMKGGAGSI